MRDIGKSKLPPSEDDAKYAQFAAGFPRSQSAGAVPDAQLKFLAVEYRGRCYSPGCTPPELHQRWQHCMQYVTQFATSCIETKAGKRNPPRTEVEYT